MVRAYLVGGLNDVSVLLKPGCPCLCLAHVTDMQGVALWFPTEASLIESVASWLGSGMSVSDGFA